MKTLLKLASKLQKNTFKTFLFLVFFNATFSFESFANQKKSSLTFDEIYVEGKRTGCVLEFLIIDQNYVHKKGSSQVFLGSFSNMILKNKIGFLFKIGAFDQSKTLKSIEKNEINFLQSDKINYAYFNLNNYNPSKGNSQAISSRYSSIKKQLTSFVGEKGEFISLHHFDGNFVADLSSSDSIEIGFNSEKNGIDKKLKIILEEQDQAEILKFTKCSLEVAEDFLDKKL